MTTPLTTPSPIRDDRGTVMMLTLGLVPIIAGLIAVGTDAAVLFTQRRALAADAESAVLGEPARAFTSRIAICVALWR